MRSPSSCADPHADARVPLEIDEASPFNCSRDNKMLWMNDINNTALKYGLFGVTIGTPTSWVVSLITWMNQLGLPWWGAIAGGWIRM